MEALREAAEAVIRAWDGWRGGSAPMPSRELDDAMAGLRESLRVTDGWQILFASAPSLTVAEYASAYLGLPVDYCYNPGEMCCYEPPESG